MVLWGAVWGGVLGLLWPGYGDWRFIPGALLGALAGWMLRGAVRQEAQAQFALLRAKAAPAAAKAADAPAPEARAAVPIPTPAPQADFQETFPQPEPVQAAADAPAPDEPNAITALARAAIAWLFGGNTVVRVGVLVLFVGLAFLAKYAIDNSLLPPQVRLAAIAAAGIALFFFGFRLRSRGGQLAYALTLQGAGVAVLYLTVFAAFRVYQFLPSGAAFVALGLICLFSVVIALAQDALAMAFIAFAGAFAAPVLVSTGQGSHVALFSYYLLLSVAIAAIAWVKAWRPLNLLGFFATFGVATAWGVLKYQPDQLATTEPFLVAFFLVYVAAAVLYATRHALDARRAVDATLVFGVPLVAFGLQAGLVRGIEYATAFSALALGAFYLALAAWFVRRGDTASRRTAGSANVKTADPASHWLAECFAALGLGFVTLAVPLALDARWTSAVWAVEGAGVFWMGRRQGRWLARGVGLGLQLFAALAYLDAVEQVRATQLPLANPVFLGAAMLAASAFAIAWWTRSPGGAPQSKMAERFDRFEQALSPFAFWVGFLWWQWALWAEIHRHAPDANGVLVAAFDEPARVHLRVLAWVGSAFLLHHLALPARKRPWAEAATPAWFAVPFMLIGAIHGVTAGTSHLFADGGWLVWPAVIAMHYTMLRRLDAGAPAALWPWVHAGGVWLIVFLEGDLLIYLVGQAGLWRTAWATVILLVSATLVLLLLGHRAWYRPQQNWPLQRHARAYLWLAAAPLAVGVAIGSLMVAMFSSGNARPLPYVPLLNPTDLAIAMGLAACTLWLTRIRESDMRVPAFMHGPAPALALAAIAFVAINTVWLRVAHHFAGIAWDARSLFDSFLVQAGYSILWTLLALVLMIVAHRRALRPAWMAGAVLLAATVLKLFVIDLSNRGGGERIVVFIAVGVLMLVVGYFAPLPPVRRAGNGTRGGGAAEAGMKEAGA